MDDLLTPCYVIDSDIFIENLEQFQKAFSDNWSDNIIFGYSVKTNNNSGFLKLADRLGMYAEVVSDDEYDWAGSVGYEPSKMIFNGPQKSEEKLMEALQSDGIVNLDNFSEIEWIRQKDFACGEIRAKVGLRINFDLEAVCPGETTAGKEVSRFGFCIENGDLYKAVEILHKKGIAVSGFHLHYSTKSRSIRIYEQLTRNTVDLIKQLGLVNEIEFIDVGGGFFYGKNCFSTGKPQLHEYSDTICSVLKEVLNPADVTLILEPGASLISTAVAYYTKVMNVRRIREDVILTTDGSSLDINPFQVKRSVIYEIHYKNTNKERNMADRQIVAGSTCMENDRFTTIIGGKELLAGDILKFDCSGAYTMGFNSCFINLPPRVYLKEQENCCIIREKNFELLKLL